MKQLSIKINTVEALFECALCGGEEHAHVGPYLFLADSWEPVCRECGDEHAEALSSLLDLAASAMAFSGAGTVRAA